MKYSPRTLYSFDKSYAKKRGVAWELTFEQWASLWEGKLDQRGRRGLSMIRINESYGYSIDNVRIGYQSESPLQRGHPKDKSPKLDTSWAGIVLEEWSKPIDKP